MTRFLMSVAALSLAMAATVEAAPHGGGGASRQGGSPGAGVARNEHSRGNAPAPYHTTHGTKFAHGYCYKGRDHKHWSCRYFWTKYGCSCWWCPSTHCWYYWCEKDDCYYPITYIVIEPVQVQAPVANPLVVLIEGSEMPTVGPDGKPLTR